MELKGQYNTAKIFTDNVEETAQVQIIELCNQGFTKDSQIRIMPDCHAGMGCVIGTTMTIQDKIVPNLVGVDIGCGMLCVELGKIDIDLQKVDEYINKNIPSGFKNNQFAQIDGKEEILKLACYRDLPKSAEEYNRALGSLGGGNHFIEINIDEDGMKYLVIHTGSRNLGNQVARFYQDKAFKYHNELGEDFEVARLDLIAEYNKTNRQQELSKALIELKNQFNKTNNLPKDLCYLEGKLMQNYLFDMKMIQEYSNVNRKIIAARIMGECLHLENNYFNNFQTIHNYIDLDNMILRKGSISAQKGEKVIIPINMRDGSIIAVGKGNPDWNYSAPHGAGRLMSRTKAKEKLLMEDYQKSMEGIFTTSVNKDTLDEAPMAYKSMEKIINNIGDTVEVLKVIKPIYNFKAGE